MSARRKLRVSQNPEQIYKKGGQEQEVRLPRPGGIWVQHVHIHVASLASCQLVELTSLSVLNNH